MEELITPQELYKEKILSDIKNFSFNDKIKIIESCLLFLLSFTNEDIFFKKIRKYSNIFNNKVSFNIGVTSNKERLKLQKEVNTLFPNIEIHIFKTEILEFLLFFDNNIYDILYKNNSLDLKIKEIKTLKEEIRIFENYTIGEISKNRKALDDSNFQEIGNIPFQELTIQQEFIKTIKAINCEDLCAVDIFEN